MKIALAETEADIARCYPVMVELRPHLSASEFATRVRKQQATGFHLAYLDEAGEVRAVAEFVEKPDAATAAGYIDTGYLWNSGNFMVRASVLLDEYRNVDADSIASVQASATTPMPPPAISATAGNTLNTINFAAVADATSYNLYWSTASPVTTSNTKITNFTLGANHTGLTNGTTIYDVATAVSAIA